MRLFVLPSLAHHVAEINVSYQMFVYKQLETAMLLIVRKTVYPYTPITNTVGFQMALLLNII